MCMIIEKDCGDYGPVHADPWHPWVTLFAPKAGVRRGAVAADSRY